MVVSCTNPRRLAEAQAARYGGQRFIATPFDIHALLDAVRELIGGAGAGGR